ncbi:hypothetical protein P152DRAFT_207179 [Eremomyces bilateralis CBS 781.70]|uniref:Uncharacterized protein n=1 Tax=Eremomyces bilateralis CBS 781.70 TaxID=1392243 RepID=A0A6G1FT26_9PEZI|nr:uncharacterized protein P152DRAFT_207179 [Eremomyces bilateralis CBS 781.70]KAF1808886.1 hypothetical protein P152DRAFT_207179 [Eremomyces bilateralis CBS 781.70]
MQVAMPPYAPQHGGMQHPGMPHGQPGHPQQGHPMGQQMHMHQGVSGPNGPHVTQPGPMMGGMQPGMGGVGPGAPSQHALSHLTPQNPMFHQQQLQQSKSCLVYTMVLVHICRRIVVLTRHSGRNKSPDGGSDPASATTTTAAIVPAAATVAPGPSKSAREYADGIPAGEYGCDATTSCCFRSWWHAPVDAKPPTTDAATKTDGDAGTSDAKSTTTATTTTNGPTSSNAACTLAAKQPRSTDATTSSTTTTTAAAAAARPDATGAGETAVSNEQPWTRGPTRAATSSEAPRPTSTTTTWTTGSTWTTAAKSTTGTAAEPG